MECNQTSMYFPKKGQMYVIIFKGKQIATFISLHTTSYIRGRVETHEEEELYI